MRTLDHQPNNPSDSDKFIPICPILNITPLERQHFPAPEAQHTGSEKQHFGGTQQWMWVLPATEVAEEAETPHAEGSQNQAEA